MQFSSERELDKEKAVNFVGDDLGCVSNVKMTLSRTAVVDDLEYCGVCGGAGVDGIRRRC